MMPQQNQPGSRRLDEQAEWLTLGRAAEYLGVAQSTIRKWCDAGMVPAFTTPGGHRRFRKSDLDGFLESSRPGAPSPQNGPVILIVDNEPGVRAYVRASLEPEGYHVEEATEADEALRLIETRSPDLIMIDNAAGAFVQLSRRSRRRDRPFARCECVLRPSARSAPSG